MNETVLLVDFENVGKIDLAAVPAGVRVPFFFGASQKSVPTNFLKAALKLGDLFQPIDIDGHGKNALDFHLAFYLGECLTKSPQSTCVVLSKDKGFDPLVKHLAKRGFAVRRVTTLAEAFGASAGDQAASADGTPAFWEAAKVWLAGMQKNKRPRKRKGLVAHLHSHFSKSVSETELERFVDRMIRDGKLTDVNGAMTYHF